MSANTNKRVYSLPQPSNNLQGPIKGHVSLKSSPFASTCTRLSSQHLVQDQMNVHYKNLNKAKSRIDSGQPRSMTTSVKKRDQLRRDAMIKSQKESSPSRPSSRASSRATPRPDSARQGSPSRQAMDKSFTSEELNHLATNGHLSPSPYSQRIGTTRSALDYRSQPDGFRTQSRLSENTKSLRFKDTEGPRLTESSRLRSSRLDQTKPASGDILDKMPDRFSSPGRPHTPRTLNTTVQSRLAQSNNYNKPKKPVAKSRRQNEHENNDIEYEETLQNYENGLEEDGDPESYKRKADHMMWLEDQTRRVESLHLEDLRDGDDDLGQTGDINLTRSHQRPFYSTGNLSNRPTSRISKRMKDEEEELLYLEFVTDVTNDVLNRGIFTNTVLKQVFDSHINRNKDRLDVGRMQHLMSQLQEDLFIPQSDDEDVEAGDLNKTSGATS
ncbi:spermatogenesis-associated protein 7-like [Asterias rubens]|uniref:spermatogenesis-associated protein 7-like n=1 Tax=Asterias rubens TaxID=7604 RepID=UPI0014552F53|nr:spermatogenesis-associated protein 7-like [Asterias rubens]